MRQRAYISILCPTLSEWGMIGPSISRLKVWSCRTHKDRTAQKATLHSSSSAVRRDRHTACDFKLFAVMRQIPVWPVHDASSHFKHLQTLT